MGWLFLMAVAAEAKLQAHICVKLVQEEEESGECMKLSKLVGDTRKMGLEGKVLDLYLKQEVKSKLVESTSGYKTGDQLKSMVLR